MNGANALAWVIVAIAVIGVLWYITSKGSGNQYGTTTSGSSLYTTAGGYTTAPTTVASNTQQTPVRMTDPLYGPTGTQAVVMSYSNVMLHTTGNSGVSNGGWVTAQGSGTVNLTSAVNSSVLLANANLAANTTVNIVRFDVVSAYAIINGTRYNITVPNNQVTAAVHGSSKINSSSAVLVDITPVISAAYNQNATSLTMAPAAKAVLVASAAGSANSSIGSSLDLNADERAALNAATPKITITSASVSASGNTTTVSVTVKDDSNSSVAINNIIVYGNQNASAKAGVGVGANVGVGGGIGANASASALARVKLNVMTFRTVNLVATSSGSLVQVSGSANAASNYTMQPGATTTLDYSGTLSYDSGMVTGRLQSGSTYNIIVTGSGGARASTTVTSD
ncbi:MAG: hypothetical protein KGI00_01740 [Candidatus Micrarchaeota archaeon]|nr:hypothetical protein [Candidatus Micrarchaeota archaeon]